MHSLHSLAQATAGSLFDGGAAEQKSPELLRDFLTGDGWGVQRSKKKKKKFFKADRFIVSIKMQRSSIKLHLLLNLPPRRQA